LLAALQGLPRIAQYPQDLGRMAPGRNADVTPEGQRLGAVRLGTVEGLRLRKVLSGRCQLTEKIQGAPEAGVGVYKTLRVVAMLGEAQEPFPQLPRLQQWPARQIEQEESPEHREELRGVAELLTQRFRPGVGLGHFWACLTFRIDQRGTEHD